MSKKPLRQRLRTALQNAVKKTLQKTVARLYRPLPPWTTLAGAKIVDVETATVGSGVVVVFQQDGVWKTLVGLAGDHYKKPGVDIMPEAYAIPGGFINLSETPGSSLVAPSDQPEDGRTGAAREIEEEFLLANGNPLLHIDPTRLVPMDTKTLRIGGQPRVVLGFMLILDAEEVARVTDHVALLNSDAAYRSAVAAQTINPATNQPEVASLRIFDLADVAEGRRPLLHQDQQSLFALTHQAVTQGILAPAKKKCCKGKGCQR